MPGRSAVIFSRRSRGVLPIVASRLTARAAGLGTGTTCAMVPFLDSPAGDKVARLDVLGIERVNGDPRSLSFYQFDYLCQQYGCYTFKLMWKRILLILILLILVGRRGWAGLALAAQTGTGGAIQY